MAASDAPPLAVNAELLKSLLGELGVEELYPFGRDHYFEELPPSEPRNRKRIQDFAQKLQVARNNLQDVKEVLEQAEKYHRAIVSPIRRLPAEMLAEIFLHTLPSPTIERPASPFNIHLTHWRLSYVCRRWRSIAIGLPGLWPDKLKISMLNEAEDTLDSDSGPYERPPMGAVHLQRLCLERSRPRLLDVEFRCSDDGNDFTDALQVITEFFKHAERFQTLDFSIDPRPQSTCGFWGSRQPVPPPRFPQLNKFVYGHGFQLPPWLMEALETAPQLKHIRTDSISFIPSLVLPHLRMTFSQITVLELGDPDDGASADAALLLMAAMPNLEECILYIDAERDEAGELHPTATLSPSGPPGVLAMQSLQSLEVASVGSSFMDTFLSRLVLPSLQQLSWLGEEHPSFVTQLIERSGCRITDFAYKPRRDVMQADVDLMSSLKAVESLSFHITIPADNLQLLEVGISFEPLCPRLTDIRLYPVHDNDGQFFEDMEIPELTEFVKSRSRAKDVVAPLKSIDIQIACHVHHGRRADFLGGFLLLQEM